MVAASRGLVRTRRRWPDSGTVGSYLLLLVVSLVFVSPLLWLISTSLKDPGVVYQYPPELLPAAPQLENYARAWVQRPMAIYFLNTMTIVLPCVLGQMLANSLVAYGFAVLDGPGKRLLFAVTLAVMMLPGTVTLIPTYLLFAKLGWINTYLPFIVPAWVGAPFYIFLLRQFFLNMPLELRDAARMDGAGELRTLLQIYLPLSGPALTTVGIFSFMHYWNDWFGPLIYVNEGIRMTLAVGLIRFVDIRDATPWELLMAASVMMLLPVLLVFLFGQRYFVRGITFSGMNG